jgi:uncharacterized protein
MPKNTSQINPSKNNVTVVTIKGMHCRSCEILIEEELLKLNGVQRVNVSEKAGTAEIIANTDIPIDTITKSLDKLGYSIGKENHQYVTKNISDWKDLFYGLLILVSIYIVLRWSGFTRINFINTTTISNISVVFLLGLTAGFSTCIALVGGLLLSITSRYAEQNTNNSAVNKLRPSIYFIIGRLISFIILGAIIGYFGSLFKIAPFFNDILVIVVSIVMLLLGLQTLQIFPILENVKLTIPTSLYKIFGIKQIKQHEYTKANSLLLGGLTFFLPCGFTQAMQLYSMSSGSALTGAITMGIFCLGTTPGILSISSLSTFVKGKYTKIFFKVVGLAVITIAVVNIFNSYKLLNTGVSNSINKLQPTTQQTTINSISTDPNVSLSNGVQIVKMDQLSTGYVPNKFTLIKNIPVKWVITSKDPYSCASSIYSSQLGIRTTLKSGENIFEFTPTKTGTINFSCSMGMYKGEFIIVENTTVQNNNIRTENTNVLPNTDTQYNCNSNTK